MVQNANPNLFKGVNVAGISDTSRLVKTPLVGTICSWVN